MSVHSNGSYPSTPSSSSNLVDIPTRWRPETQQCLESKVTSDEARNDIVRTLVTLLIAKVGPKPTRRECEQVGRLLLLQYPFLKDDLGPGYVSS